MVVSRRMFNLLAVVLLAVSTAGMAVAQTDGPDPTSPIKLETPDTDESQSEDGTLDQEQPTQRGGLEPGATPGAATDPPLAAMTLDSSSFPEGWFLIQEAYTGADELIDSLRGQVDADALIEAGLVNYYDSYYINMDGNTIRTYIIEFETAEGAAGGFALLEDEETVVPNGAFEDLPAPADLGDGPSEISSGTISNGDGTETNSYDVSFTVGRYEVGTAMETYDDSEPDSDLVDALAADLAERVAAVLAGEQVSGVEMSLPGHLITMDVPVGFEGFQNAAEAFLIADPELIPDDFLSGYYRGASYSGRIVRRVPYVTIGVSVFESARDVENALETTDQLMPNYDDLEELDDVEVDGADATLAFTFSSPEGNGDVDSARLFIQVDDLLISIDVQGETDVDTAIEVAEELASLQVSCVVEGDCQPAVLAE